MKRSLIIAAACLPLAWIATGTESAPPSSIDKDIVVRHGEMLAGARLCDTFTVPRGTLAYVREDLRVIAKGRISIEGTLVCLPSRRTDDGPDVILTSDDSVFVSGLVHGAAGRSFDAQLDDALGAAGGEGSSIVLHAPQMWVAGAVIAGPGGRGGLGGAGGTGGTLLSIGRPPVAGTVELPEAYHGWLGGGGGRGGQADRRVNNGTGGRGGDGGPVLAYGTLDEVPEEYLSLLD